MIGFVFTNYNNSEYTKNAIASLSCCKVEKKIVIVDNNSELIQRNKLEAFCSGFSDIEIIYNSENVGYFSGLNIGINFLRENYDIEIMIVGNNDVEFSESFCLDVLKKQKLFLKYPVISPSIVTSDGIYQNPHVVYRKSISKFRLLIYRLYNLNFTISRIITVLAFLSKRFTKRSCVNYYNEPQEIYMGYGAMYILTPLFFKHFNKLDESVFLMHEEYFLSEQLQKEGLSIFYEPSIKLTHLMNAATGELSSKKKWKYSSDSYKKIIKLK